MSTTRQSSRAFLVLSLIGVLSGYAWAAGRSDISAQESSTTLERASHLIGHTVQGSDGQTLGSIYDIVLTPDLDSVSYVALSRGGAFGLGRELYTVPLPAFSKGPGKTYYLPITENHLLTQKGFNEAYWPASPSAGWVAGAGNIGMSADQAITREESREVQKRRVSKLIGTNVKDAQGKRSGNVRDFVIEKDTGQVAYSIVSYDGFFGFGTRFAAVPSAAINIDLQRNVATLTVDRNTLAAGSFTPMQWPDLSSPAFEQRVAALYGTQPPSGVILGYVPPESSAKVEPGTGLHEAREPAREQGLALGYQAPAPTPESLAAVRFDPANVQTLEGTVVDTGKLGGAAGALALRLKIADDKIVTVTLCPRDYIGKQNFYIVDGDRIAVTGAHATVSGRPMFIAADIRGDGQFLRLRDRSGQPLWLQSASTHVEEDEDVDAVSDMPEESPMD